MELLGKKLGDLVRWEIKDFRYENTTKEQVINFYKNINYFFCI
jgi:hypothetical protein